MVRWGVPKSTGTMLFLLTLVVATVVADKPADSNPGNGHAAAAAAHNGHGGNGNGGGVAADPPGHSKGQNEAARPQQGPSQEGAISDPGPKHEPKSERGADHNAENGKGPEGVGNVPIEKRPDEGTGVSSQRPAPPEVRKSHDLTHTLRVKKVQEGHELSWAATDNETLGYQVWRSNSPFALVATIPAHETRYVDPAPPANSKYKVTYYTEPSLEQGFVPADAPPAELPEWNPDVFAAASVEATQIVQAQTGSASFWIAIAEGLLLLGGVSFAVARPELSAKALSSARSGILRFTAQFTLSVIIVGERLERALGLRLVARFNDHELRELFEFLMQPAAAPRPARAQLPLDEMPRLNVGRLYHPDAQQA